MQHFVRDGEARGLFHAPHVYSLADVELCIASIEESLDSLKASVPLITTSSTTGEAIHEKPNLVRQACEDILCKQSDTTNLLNELKKNTNTADLRLIPIGPSSNTQTLATELMKQELKMSIFETSYESMLRSNSLESAGSGQIAIVGMSGRFPGAQNTEEYCK